MSVRTILFQRLGTEIPNSWYVNQYDNPSNAQAHYEQTGPEIWEQTDGKLPILLLELELVEPFLVLGKYLKEKIQT
jgi:cystathionine beta-synthase